jgi:hypothetical protein
MLPVILLGLTSLFVFYVVVFRRWPSLLKGGWSQTLAQKCDGLWVLSDQLKLLAGGYVANWQYLVFYIAVAFAAAYDVQEGVLVYGGSFVVLSIVLVWFLSWKIGKESFSVVDYFTSRRRAYRSAREEDILDIKGYNGATVGGPLAGFIISSLDTLCALYVAVLFANVSGLLG